MSEEKRSPREILAEYKEALARGPAFEDFARQHAESARRLLDRILSDETFLRQVAQSRRPYDLSYPTWAQELAWILWNPSGRVSLATRRSVWDICVSLLHEIKHPPEERLVTGELCRNSTVRFLSDLARDLSEARSTRYERPDGPSKGETVCR